jgi:TldD protein
LASTSARDLAREALIELRRAPDVVYADVRFVDEERELLRVRNGSVDSANRRRSTGFGVRVLADGGWGFACTSELCTASMIDAAKTALSVARASARASVTRVRWAERPPQRGTYATPFEIDPLEVPLDEKISDLIEAVELLAPGRDGIRAAEAKGDFARRRQLLLTTEGTDVEQTFVYTGAGIVAYAVGDDGISQRRSFPTSVDSDQGQGGYERIAAMDLTANAPRIRAEALELLRAPPLPAGKRDVVLATNQLALQIHESCGHPAELDRALGTEVSLAGGSFLVPDMLNRFQYGSELVSLTADATMEGGLGTIGYDDEGIPGGRVPLVTEGTFTGYLSSRETAEALGLESSGAMRADSYARPPLIRMVNVNLEPGEGGFADLLADSDNAILFETNKSWSIDDLRLHFQFGCEIAWEVRGGRRVQMYRDPVYSGTTPAFWRSCDAVAGPESFRLWGFATCGKGEPMQIMRVGHGASPARFRGVTVGHG